MKVVIIILFVLNLACHCSGQKSYHINFPDSLTGRGPYINPVLKPLVHPSVFGVLKADESIDSIHSENSWRYFWESEFFTEGYDKLMQRHKHETGLQIIVDTGHEVLQKYYLMPYLYEKPRQDSRRLKFIDSNGRVTSMNCNNDSMLKIIAMPVYITNFTNDTLHIIDRDYAVDILQEVMDKQGRWVEIEQGWRGGCGMAWGWKALPPNQVLITSVLKYKGSFKTKARLKLANNALVYSNTFEVSIDPAVLHSKQASIVRIMSSWW